MVIVHFCLVFFPIHKARLEVKKAKKTGQNTRSSESECM